jgi:hypothetical protein
LITMIGVAAEPASRSDARRSSRGEAAWQRQHPTPSCTIVLYNKTRRLKPREAAAPFTISEKFVSGRNQIPADAFDLVGLGAAENEDACRSR